MRAVERRAATLGSTCVNLEVEEANKPALDLYSKLGYKEVGRDEKGRKLVGDILFGRSERVTKLSLEKRLDQDSVAEEEGQF
jgi:ribosomal protein S18 acetylase RimI-like enzyme